jgi:teichuronic acid exporter
MSDLQSRTIKGMVWKIIESFGLQSVHFMVTIVLARLLLPEQFGLIGMLALFMALAQSLLDSGFGSALIRKKDASHLDTCSIFYLNLILGILLTALLYGAAPWIARFYNEPLLTSLTRFLSLNILINAFGLVPSAMLTKRMEFKALLMVNMISVIISGAVGMGMALNGMGVWSLAVQSVLNTLLRASLLWLASRWRPSLIFSRIALATMFSFGSRLLLSGLMETFFQNIYNPLIGKVYSATDLGYFTRAQNLHNISIQPEVSALWYVMLPALSPLQDDQARLKQAVQKAMTTAVFFHFPLMIGLIASAPSIIPLLLTDRWAPSIPYFQLFCVAGFLYPMHVLNLIILQVIGRSDLFLRLEVLKKLLIIIGIAVTYRWGITAMLWGQVATSALAYLLNSYYSRHFIGYSTIQQIRDTAPFLFISLMMGAGMYFSFSAVEPALPKLMAQTFIGLSVYFVLIYIFRRLMLFQVLNLARRMVQPATAG